MYSGAFQLVILQSIAGTFFWSTGPCLWTFVGPRATDWLSVLLVRFSFFLCLLMYPCVRMCVCFKTERETNKYAQKEIKAPEASSPAACLVSVDGCLTWNNRRCVSISRSSRRFQRVRVCLCSSAFEKDTVDHVADQEKTNKKLPIKIRLRSLICGPFRNLLWELT